jgi:hypothetical protein
MAYEKRTTAEAEPEQVRYANLLFYGSWLAIFLMIITYIVYLSGVMDPYIPLSEVADHWVQSSDHYIHEGNVPTGWGWVTLLGNGDFLNFLGIALLAGMTVIAFFTLIPAYAKKKDIPFLVLTILEIVVLCIAASGLLGMGGH